MKVFHHDDMDGRCAGAIVAFRERNYNRSDFFEVNYVTPLPLDKVENGEKVYLVDYSFTESTVWQLEELIDAKECEVIWIDHHTSSISLINDETSWLHKNIDRIDGIRDIRYCGAALTWLFFMFKGTEYCDSSYREEVLTSAYDYLPQFIKFVDDYDCWKNNLQPDTDYFKLELERHKYGALDRIWKNLLNNRFELKDFLIQGAVVKSYVDSELTRYRKSFSYESEVRVSETKTILCLVVNRRMNSWIFGEMIDKYPLVIAWVFDGERFLYSLYSSNPEIDCSKIAEKYNGGGHKGAAGFSSKELLFRKVKQDEK